MTEISILHRLVAGQRSFFASGLTRDLAFRREQLRLLRKAVAGSEDLLFQALKQDLGKPAFEAYAGESAIVVNEIDAALRRLRSWSRPVRVRTPIAFFPARSSIVPEPYGVALIIGPWNFPVQLMLAPLVSALAAGNCAVLKPSADAPHTSRVLLRIIEEHFDPAHVAVVEGGAETAHLLLAEKFDYIFFTGGPATGRIVMAAAAKQLTPVTLELGGKNPCIVDADTPLDIAARRIVWGKFFNTGQSCVAVDYLLADRRIKEELLSHLVRRIRLFYGDDPSRSPDYGRIVNDRHFERLRTLIPAHNIVIGGETDRAARYIAPTVIDNVTGAEPFMEDEIFGPLLPVLSYDSLEDALEFVNSRPRPLALYLFTRDRRRQEQVLRGAISGGGCINDTVIHETMSSLPFGGVGDSGVGNYHGRAGFDTFSHHRSIVRNGFFPGDLFRYPPYRDRLKLLRRLF